jgi:beta-1,4-mannosyl-glycoprotein beta-1,4-N-acetylglucosaminyltransferase
LCHVDYLIVLIFKENFLTNIRFEILNDYIDYFVICELIYDHNGNKKNLNFKLDIKNIEKKIIYITLDFPFSNFPIIKLK